MIQPIQAKLVKCKVLMEVDAPTLEAALNAWLADGNQRTLLDVQFGYSQSTGTTEPCACLVLYTE